MRVIAAIIALVLALAPAAAQDRIGTADLETVSRRGAQIYAFDQAAWHTTDSMVAKALPDETMAAIRGWVVEPHGDMLTVTYYGLDGAKPYTIYAADYAGEKVVAERVPATKEPLTPRGERMAAALDAARALDLRGCVERPFNTVVLPPQADDIVPVYLLTPMIQSDVYPLGGHHEVDVAANGKVVGMRDFTKSCLPMQPPEKSAAFVMVSHLLDPHPTEIHVYLSLWMGKPIAVATGGGTGWMVEGTKVSLLESTAGARKR